MAGKLRGSEWLAAAGTLTLFVSTFLPWFSLPTASQLSLSAPGARVVGIGADAPIHLNVWDLGFARWWIYLTVLLGAWMVLAALFSRTPDWSTILCTPLGLTSFIAVVCLVVRVLVAPRPNATALAGLYLALVGAAAVFAAVGWALRDETVPDGFDKAPRPELIQVD